MIHRANRREPKPPVIRGAEIVLETCLIRAANSNYRSSILPGQIDPQRADAVEQILAKLNAAREIHDHD